VIVLIETEMGSWLAEKIQPNFKTILLEVVGLGVGMFGQLTVVVRA